MTGENEERSSRPVRREQKSVGWMQDSGNKFSKAGDLVVDLSIGTFSSAKEFSELPRHRRSEDFKVHADRCTASTETLLGTYARQILNEKSNSSGINEVVITCKIVGPAVHRLRDREPMRSWKVSAGLCLLQMLLSRTVQFRTNLFANPILFHKGHQNPLIQ